MENKTIQNIINKVCNEEKLSLSLLQRHFCISFPKGAKIVEELIEKNIIKKLEVGYKILSKQKLKEQLTIIFN